MKRKFLVTVLCAVLLLSVTSCGPKKIQIKEEINGQAIELKTGQKISISLESNPTTGFNWEVIEIDPLLLKQVGEPDYKSDSKLIGAGGVITFTFEALQTGKSTVKLIYHRSFEKDVAPEKTYEVFIEVK